MSDGLEDISAPEPLRPEDDLGAFDSGVAALDEWLKRRAAHNQETGASRTYVIRRKGQVVGYYALANGAVTQAEATGRTRRNMPDPIPVMVLGRLAVDKQLQGKGIGRALLRDAMRLPAVAGRSDDADDHAARCGEGALLRLGIGDVAWVVDQIWEAVPRGCIAAASTCRAAGAPSSLP